MNFRRSVASRRSSKTSCARSGICEMLTHVARHLNSLNRHLRARSADLSPRSKPEDFVRKSLDSVLIALALSCLLAPAAAQDFYRGKTVNVVVGNAAGGGYDLYARLLARHMGRYIPGEPN